MQRLKKLQIPYQRPVDFYAEMVKTDKHMSKVKAKLIQEQNKIKAVEDHKLQEKNTKFGKQARAYKLQEQARLKRQALESIKNLRKTHGGRITDDMIDATLKKAEKNDGKQFTRKRKLESREDSDEVDEEFKPFSRKKFAAELAKKPRREQATMGSKYQKSKKKDPKSRPGKSQRIRKFASRK